MQYVDHSDSRIDFFFFFSFLLSSLLMLGRGPAGAAATTTITTATIQIEWEGCRGRRGLINYTDQECV